MEIVDLKELALKKVKINGNVIGKFGTFEIEQTFKNNTKNVLEVGYTFPIVETATVVGFEINVGDKILKGKCKEKGEAKKEYQRNIVQGNSAYMMEQASDNIFKIAIGKIDKDEEVKLKIYYIDKFEITDNTIKILIPTLVTPRYKSNITNKLLFGKVDYTVDFNINVSKALNRKSINCVSHKINLIDEEKTEKVEVLNYDLSSDFKLYIELKNELSSNAIISKTRDDKEMIYLSFMPEILDTYEDSEKEYMFIIDISGSMYGNKMEETKKAVIECLKQLDIGDKFNIIPFESRFSAMNINSIEYNEENLQKAIEYVNDLQPTGGTEILNPIKFALYQKETDKIILLFTDGQVGNEQEIIQYVDENIKTSRIFSFGIDTNVNSSFIKQLAKVGNGKAELIQPNEKIDDKIIRTFARIQTPLLENLEIDYGKNKVIDEIDHIIKKYDKNAIMAGEGPCMKDLVNIADEDFKNVSITSIGIIFIIMLFVLKSVSLPVLLVSGIELAIFINMAISYYTGDVLPFVASIVIGTIQLGATIDYAILLTTKYLENRKNGIDKIKAMDNAISNSAGSIFVSGMSFFAATFGVGMISKLNMIGSLCNLMSRGALISMFIVICVIPAILLVFDKVIIHTSIGFKQLKNNVKGEC